MSRLESGSELTPDPVLLPLLSLDLDSLALREITGLFNLRVQN